MSNKELLDWAVENIEEWDDRYTHLRCDETDIFFTEGEDWGHEFGYDCNWSTQINSSNWEYLGTSNFTRAAQVINKEEWQEAKQPKPLLSSILKNNLIVMQEYARRLLAGESVDGLQYSSDGNNWCDFPCGAEPNFLNNVYLNRWKPDEVTHKGGTYPRPLTKEEGDKLRTVWSISPANECCYYEFMKVQDFRYNSGLVFKSEEDAKQAAKVMFNMGD